MDIVKKIIDDNPINNGYSMCGVYSYENNPYSLDLTGIQENLEGRLKEVSGGTSIEYGTPLSSSGEGVAGDRLYDEYYDYTCISDNSWQKASRETKFVASSISGTVDNLAVSGAKTIELSTNSATGRTITGLAMVPKQWDGEIHIIRNVGTGALTLSNNSSSSLAENRFRAAVSLSVGKKIFILYKEGYGWEQIVEIS